MPRTRSSRSSGFAAALVVACAAASSSLPTPSRADEPPATNAKTQLAREIVVSYADAAFGAYRESGARAKKLLERVREFVAAPTEERLATARTAWIEARRAYGMTEALRFYGGPIDNPKDGPEMRLNAWPVDESYIDAVRGNPSSGIVQDPERVPHLAPEVLMALNERGGESNICIGWHAVEFLLWGQDLDPKTPGQRPATDYQKDKAPHADRRGEMLVVTTALIVKHLAQLEAAWAPNRPDNYRAQFTSADPMRSIEKLLTGLTVLSAFEMAGERLAVAYETQDAEEEHSCFSDTTHEDFRANQAGIVAFYRGHAFGAQGPGLRTLAHQLDPKIAREIDDALDRTTQAIAKIPAPFDQAFLGDDEAPGRRAMLEAMRALEAQANLFATLGLLLGFQVPLTPGG